MNSPMAYHHQIEPDAGFATDYPVKPAAVAYAKSGADKPERVMFEPGDTVRVRQLGVHAPRMVVKQASKVPHETEPGRTRLLGILCFWFGPHSEPHEQLFNTKDLEVLDKARKD